MTITELNSVTGNLRVTVPVFTVKPGSNKGDAKKAFPGDRFVAGEGGINTDEDPEIEISFFRIASNGQPETKEDGDLMDPWVIPLDQMQYSGETTITLKMHNQLCNY
jgi:hypothetical protein